MRPPHSGRSLSERFYGLLLKAYSPALRHAAGADMSDTFRDSYHRARLHGRGRLATLWAVTLLDVLASAIPDRLQQLRKPTTKQRPPDRRRGSVMDNIIQDVKYAVRTLIRTPGFTVVVVVTLALGIGANTAIFSLVNEVLLRPIPISEPDRVVRLYTSDFSSGLYGSSSYPDYVEFGEQSTALQGLAAFTFTLPVNLSTDGVAERVQGTMVSGNFFSVLGVQPAAGRLLAPSDDVTPGGHPVAVLSHGTWQRRFGGSADVIGQSITLNGHPFTIVGVAPEKFTGVTVGAFPEVWTPLHMYAEVVPFLAGVPVLDGRGSRWLGTVGRLAPGATIGQLQIEATAIMARLAEEYPQTNLGTLQQPNRPRPITIESAQDAALGGGARAGAMGRAQLLMVIVGFVLLIACANVANLLLARANKRRRELAVRLALGAGRSRLVSQLLTESIVLGVLGGAVGLALAYGLGRALIPLGLPTALQGSLNVPELALDGRVLGFAFVVSIMTGLAFGLLPALHASRPNLIPALKDSESAGVARASRFGVRDALVVLQVAASLILLVGAGLFVRSTLAAYDTELGFESRGVLLTSLDAGRQGLSQEQGEIFYDQLLQRVSSLPGVQTASLSSVVPVQAGGARTTFVLEGYQPDASEDMELNINVVSSDFLRTLQTPLLRGRAFAPSDDANAPLVAVVNQNFSDRFYAGEDPIGKRMQNGRGNAPWIEIVGVVADGKYRDVREAPMPYVYLPLAQRYQGIVTLAVRTASDPAAMLPSVRAEVKALDASMPLYNVRTLREQLDLALSQERSTATMIGSLGLLALILAAVGIYGVMAYAVAQRTQEIGIRSALGARGSDVRRLVLGRGIRLAGVGVLVGAIAAAGLGRLISSFVVGVNPTDPITFAGVAALLAIVAMIASYIPARRASRVDPMTALRYE